MATKKYVSEKIQIGVSDYLGATIISGILWLVPYKKVSETVVDKHLFEGVVNVQYGATSQYILAPGEGLRIEATKLSSGDSFECSLITTFTDDVESPNIIVDNFDGIMSHINDTVFEQVLELSIQPLVGATADSRYDIKINSLTSNLVPGINLEEDVGSNSTYADYPSVPQMVMVWDVYRHRTVKLDFTFGYGSGENTGHQSLVVNSVEGKNRVFPFHWNRSEISKVDIVVHAAVEDDDGIFSLFSKASELPANPSELYEEYDIIYEEYQTAIDTARSGQSATQESIEQSSSSNDSY